jgi:hypothetical protein
VDACSDCGSVRISYNSCRNRHCPTCQGRKREEWIQAREAELLAVPYLHVVFTLPEQLNALALHHPKAVYVTLFEAAWQTMPVFGKDEKHLGARPGMIAVLHTWGQTLSLPPTCIASYRAVACPKPASGKRPAPSFIARATHATKS